MNYSRVLDLEILVKKRSYFLFGPRAIGKSTLIRQAFPNAKFYDLLDPNTFNRLVQEPKSIEYETKAEDLVIIDEIQKYPLLLDLVHKLIFERQQKFLLIGNSARKLKRGGVNLLANLNL